MPNLKVKTENVMDQQIHIFWKTNNMDDSAITKDLLFIDIVNELENEMANPQ